jgi:SH3 domain protein
MYKSLLLVLVLWGSVLQAQTAYVTDRFTVTVRSGESTKYRIIAVLETGEPVSVLSVNPETGYTKVRMKNGREGYMLSRQLQKDIITRDQLKTLQRKIDDMQSAPDSARRELAVLTQRYAKLQSTHQELTNLKRQIETELTTVKRTAADAIRISNERNQLRKQVTDLTRANEELKQEKIELKNKQQQRWFLIGAGVVILGILVGLILPRLYVRRQKESSWGSSLSL